MSVSFAEIAAKMFGLQDAPTFEAVSELCYMMYKFNLQRVPRTDSVTVGAHRVLFDKIKITSLLNPFPALATLQNACIGPSPIHGTGVFAQRDLKRKELITFYPADVVRMRLKPKYITAEADHFCVYSDKFNARFSSQGDKNAGLARCKGNFFNVDDATSIAAHPELHDGADPRLLGHFINDGCLADPLHLSDDAYAAQIESSLNCIIVPTKGGLCVAVVATQDIPKGAEITTSYGSAYWSSRRLAVSADLEIKFVKGPLEK